LPRQYHSLVQVYVSLERPGRSRCVGCKVNGLNQPDGKRAGGTVEATGSTHNRRGMCDMRDIRRGELGLDTSCGREQLIAICRREIPRAGG
jgi:hypothetical protein